MYRNDTDTQSSKVIHINSIDLEHSFSSGHTTDFRYNLQTPIICPENQKMLISCIGATIPYTFYNIRENINDKLVVSEGPAHTNYTITIQPGNYTATSLAQELTTKINAQISTPLGTTINIAYQKTTMKFVATFTGVLSGLVFNTQIERKNCSVELGLNDNTITTINNFDTFPNVADVNGSIHGLYLRTDLVSDGVFDSQSKSLSYILARIPIRVNFGGVIFYESFEGVNHKIELDKRHISNIRVRLTDERNRLVNLNGLNFNLSILIDFVYKEKSNT